MGSFSGIIERTYLIERVVGLSVYVIALFLTYYMVKRAKNYREVRRSLNMYLIILTIMGLFFVPDASKDLTRILRNTEYWKTISLGDLFQLELSRSSTPLGQIYIYLCRKTQIDGFLPACTAFLFFHNVFYILKKCYQKLNCSSSSIAVSLLFFMSSGCFLEVISDIRCFLAFSIVARFIFDEVCLNKNIVRSLPFYLAAVLIHLSVFPVIVIRLLSYFLFESKRKTIVRWISMVVVLAASFAAFIFLRELIDAVFAKANSYLSGGNYKYVWEYIIGAGFIGVIVYILRNYKITTKVNSTLAENASFVILFKISVIFLLGEVIFCFEYNIFHRYILMSLFFAIPLLSGLLTSHAAEQAVFKRNVIILSILILGLVCMRGNLCGYKFFIL